jgi:hypothetical protein
MPITPDGQLESLKLTPTQRTALLKQVRDHYAEAVDARGDWPTRHDRRFRRFLADPTLRPTGPWVNAPRLFTTDTRSAFETIHSQLWTGVFPGMESVTVDPFDEAALDHLETAEKTMRHCLRYCINDADKGGWAHIGKMALFDALCDSTGFLKVYPWRPPWRDATPDTLIRIDNVDEGTLLIPPGASGTQYPDAPYFGQEVYVRWDDLVRKKRQGFRVPARDAFQPRAQPVSDRERTEEEREGRQVDPDREGYLVVELYERFVLDRASDEEEDIVVSFYPDLDDEHCLGRVLPLTELFPNQVQPLRPFFAVTVWAMPRQLRGLNVPDRMETPQDILNRLSEQMVNYGDVSILPFFFYNALVTGDLPDLRQVMPGQGVPVNDLGGIQQVERASLNRHFLEQGQYWSSKVEGDLHISDFSTGRAPTRPNAPRTLGGTQLLLQQGREAFSGLVQHLGYQYSAPLDFYWRLWQHYVPPGMQVPLKRAKAVPSPQGPPPTPLFDSYAPFGPPPSNGADALGMGAAAPGGMGLPGLPGAPPPGMAPPAMPGMGMPPGMAPPGLPPGMGEGPAVEHADALMQPEAERLLAAEVLPEDLEGIYSVHLKVNPDLPFDRQVLTQLGTQMVPILQPIYPIGARLLVKKIWEVNGQTGFDAMYPEAIAMMQTQLLFAQIMQQQQMMQAQAQMAQQPQGPPPPPPEPPPPGSDPQTMQALEAAMQAQAGADAHAAQAQMHGQEQGMTREQMKTAQEYAKMLQQLAKVQAMADTQGQNGGTRGSE